MSAFDPKDGGWQSRKLALTILTQGLIFLGAILAGRYALMGPHYEMMVGGLIACLASFLGVNVAAKWAIGKNINVSQAGQAFPEDPTESEDEPEPVQKPKTLAELAKAQDDAKHGK